MAGAAPVRPFETHEEVKRAGAKAQNGKILIAPIEEQKDEGVPTPPELEEEFYRKPRVIKRPNAPTKQEVADHLPLHLQCRSWCPDCVAGRGIASPHKTGTDEEQIGATISLDYCFMTEEDKDTDMCPVLIMYDHTLKAIWALPVENKGVVDYVDKWCVETLDNAGYTKSRITMQS